MFVVRPDGAGGSTIIVSCKYAPAFATLALVQSAGEGLHAGYNNAPAFATLALVQSAGEGLHAGYNIFSRYYALPQSRNVERFCGCWLCSCAAILPWRTWTWDCVEVSTRKGSGGWVWSARRHCWAYISGNMRQKSAFDTPCQQSKVKLTCRILTLTSMSL